MPRRACPAGPVTVTGIRFVPGHGRREGASVPSPPSAMGRTRTSSRGRTRASPAASAAPALAAPIVPLKESGAITHAVSAMVPLVRRA